MNMKILNPNKAERLTSAKNGFFMAAFDFVVACATSDYTLDS